MRIITGSAKGTKLETLEGEKTRPTTERVKEAVFSVIQFDIEGRRVLDLFGGSGQMALEALSRGAESATIVDNNIEAVNIIKRNAQKAKVYDRCRILNNDYTQYIRSVANREKFHIVFVDPPYGEKLVGDVLKKLNNADIVAPGGIVICENDEEEPADGGKFKVYRQYRYSKTFVTVYIREEENDGDDE